MGRTSEYVGALVVVFAVGGLVFNQETQLVTRFFNIAVIFLALTPAVRQYVWKQGGTLSDVRTRTAQWFGVLLIVFAGAIPFLTPIGFLNYGTLLLVCSSILYLSYWTWKVAGDQPYMKPLIIIVTVGIFAGGAFLVPWSQVEGPAGTVGSTLESTVGGTVSAVSTAGEYTFNTMIRQNRQVARLQCIMEHGGPTGIAFTPSSEISNCVQQKLGQNETVTRSNRVTDPVEIQVDEPNVEPFTEEVRVSVPLSNTLVFDRFGVPIEDIPAKDVEVSVEWYYNNELALRETESLGRIENGDSRVTDFTFEYATPGNSFWDASELEIGDPERGNLVPGLGGYSMKVNTTYTYGAEAAFTESSRWRSGNNLLKVWRPDAWRDRSLDFRQQWERDNCETVRRFGQEFDKQRTAALTTPVTPVMYTDCATSLFRGFEGGTGSVPISLSATGPEGGGDVERFKVVGGGTNCREGFEKFHAPGDGDGSIEWEDFGEWNTFSPGLGWGLSPTEISPTVTIDGERTTVSCKANMTIRTELSPYRDSVTLPDLLTEGEGTGVHTLDWRSLEISSSGEATLTFDEDLASSPEEGDIGVTEPEGASIIGSSESDGSDTWEIFLSGVEEGDTVTLGITGTIEGEDGGRLSLERCTVTAGGDPASCSSAGTPS